MTGTKLTYVWLDDIKPDLMSPVDPDWPAYLPHPPPVTAHSQGRELEEVQFQSSDVARLQATLADLSETTVRELPILDTASWHSRLFQTPVNPDPSGPPREG